MTTLRWRQVGIAAVAGAAITVTMATPGIAAPAAAENGLRLVATKHSLLGTHQWYQQTYGGLPVVDGYYAKHPDSVTDGRKTVGGGVDLTPSVGRTSAVGHAVKSVTDRAARSTDDDKDSARIPAATTGRGTLAVQGGKSPRLVWQVDTASDQGDARALVDAETGKTLSIRKLSHDATGAGQVFDPNPVVTLRDESLQDQDDANQAVFGPAYKRVQLRNLDGSGKLSGKYVTITKARGGLATSDTGSFVYLRHSDDFEQVMAYYQLNQTQEYIQGLGFTDVNNEPQDVRTNTFNGDNSFYSPNRDDITFGRGGVDDAEDAEVIWHEYGHAIQDDQVPGFGSTLEAGSIGEGFGDYWALTNSEPVSGGFDLPCIMDWDSTSYTTTEPHCLRRTDTGKTTDDIVGEVHADGEIWSNALWDIHRALGRERTDTLILEAQFSYAPDTSFADAAEVTVATARQLYGSAAAKTCERAFQARKIL